MPQSTSANSALKRDLPTTTYVSLAEAITWLAFRDAMPADALRADVNGVSARDTLPAEESARRFLFDANDDYSESPGSGHFSDREAGLETIANAWRRLREYSDKGTLVVRGCHTAGYLEREASVATVQNLSGSVLATFSQFDISTGGIRRRSADTPEVLWQGHAKSLEREFASFASGVEYADGYLQVEVERSGLQSIPRIPATPRSPAIKQAHPPSNKEILKKADEMKARGLNGREIAKAMRMEPGFEHVGTNLVRELVKGRWKGGRSTSTK